jgi:15-cis-phytoene synthase/lycopene beta-cyclase
MIVFGLVAFDNAMAILDTFTVEFPTVPALPSPAMMVRALLMPTHLYNEDRICGLQQALLRLNKKSRSFSIASCVFSGRVRTDLILLYSFCRIADDLVDEAASTTEARKTIVALRAYLDRAYAPRPDKLSSSSLRGHVTAAFPATAHQALFHLPTEHMPPEPLYELLDGFDMDLDFGDGKWPIQTESDLELYAKRVASTVAELCIHLVYKHHGLPDPRDDRTKGPAQVIEAGVGMGIALQLVNIARDIQADARMDRVYVPATWLKNHGMTPEDLIAAYKEKVVSPAVTVKIEAMRRDLLHWALRLYDETRPNIEHLPAEARGGVRVMVDSYVEIGHVLLLHGGKERDWGYRGRATVPAHRRLAVAWRGMAAP